MLNYLFILGGLALLLFGGELLVRGAISLARKLDVSMLVIAFTVVAFGTSMPELVVSLEAAISGSPSLAIGNVVGSNIANILLVLGLPALIASISINGSTMKRDAVFVVMASILLTIFAASNPIVYWEGIVLFLLIIMILFYSYTTARKETNQSLSMAAENDPGLKRPKTIVTVFLAIFFGLAGLFIGSKILIIGAIGLAHVFGIPESVIGLTLIAFGTSLPELATSVVADVLFGAVLSHGASSTSLGIVNFTNP